MPDIFDELTVAPTQKSVSGDVFDEVAASPQPESRQPNDTPPKDLDPSAKQGYFGQLQKLRSEPPAPVYGGTWMGFATDAAKLAGNIGSRLLKGASVVSALMPPDEQTPAFTPEAIQQQKEYTDRVQNAVKMREFVESNPLYKLAKENDQYYQDLYEKYVPEKERETVGHQVLGATAGLAPVLAGPFAPLVFALDSAGEHYDKDYQQLLDEGKTKEEAATTAANNAYLSGAKEMALWEFGPRAFRKLVGDRIRKIGGPAADWSVRWLRNHGASGAELGTLSGASAASQNVIEGRPVGEGVGTAIASGALLGAAMPGGKTKEEAEVDAAFDFRPDKQTQNWFDERARQQALAETMPVQLPGMGPKPPTREPSLVFPTTAARPTPMVQKPTALQQMTGDEKRNINEPVPIQPGPMGEIPEGSTVPVRPRIRITLPETATAEYNGNNYIKRNGRWYAEGQDIPLIEGDAAASASSEDRHAARFIDELERRKTVKRKGAPNAVTPIENQGSVSVQPPGVVPVGQAPVEAKPGDSLPSPARQPEEAANQNVAPVVSVEQKRMAGAQLADFKIYLGGIKTIAELRQIEDDWHGSPDDARQQHALELIEERKKAIIKERGGPQLIAHSGDRSTQVIGTTESYPAEYASVPESDLVPSHDPKSFTPIPLHFGNTRDYEKNAGEQEKVVQGRNTWQSSRYVTDSPDSSVGPVIAATVVQKPSDNVIASPEYQAAHAQAQASGQPKRATYGEAKWGYQVLPDGRVMSLIAAGGNSRRMMISGLPPEKRAELDALQTKRAGIYGVSPQPGELLTRVLPTTFDVGTEQGRLALRRVMDQLNPSPGRRQATTERARIDAETKIDPGWLLGVEGGMDVSPQNAQTAVRELLGRAEQLGLDRNNLSATGESSSESQQYLQQLQMHGAYRNPVLSAAWSDNRIGNYALRQIIQSGVRPMLELRRHNLSTVADLYSRMMGTVSHYVDQGKSLSTALEMAAAQMELSPDTRTVQRLAEALKEEMAFTKTGSVDYEETGRRSTALLASVANAVHGFNPEPSMFGAADTADATIARAIDSAQRASGRDKEIAARRAKLSAESEAKKKNIEIFTDGADAAKNKTDLDNLFGGPGDTLKEEEPQYGSANEPLRPNHGEIVDKLARMGGALLETSDNKGWPNFVDKMVKAGGERVRPYLKEAYNQIRDTTEARKWGRELTSREELDNNYDDYGNRVDRITGAGKGDFQGAGGTRTDVPGVVRGSGVGGRPGLRVVDETDIPEPRPYVSRDGYTGAKGDRADEAQRLGANSALTRFFHAKQKSHLLADGTGVGKTLEQLIIAAEAVKQTGKFGLIVMGAGKLKSGDYQAEAFRFNVPLSKIRFASWTDIQSGKVEAENYGVVIFDEAHKIRNPGTATFLEAQKLIKAADHVLYATATPMARPYEATYFLSEITGLTPEQIQKRLGFTLAAIELPDGKVIYEPVLDRGASIQTVTRNLREMRSQAVKAGALLRREYPFHGKFFYKTHEMDAAKKAEHGLIYDYFTNRIEAAVRARAFTAARMISGQRTLTLQRWGEHQLMPEMLAGIKEDVAAGRVSVVAAKSIGPQSVKGYQDASKKAVAEWKVLGLLDSLAKELDKAGIEYAKVYDDNPETKAKAVATMQRGHVRVLLMTPQSGGESYSMDDIIGDRPRVLRSTLPRGGVTVDQLIGRISRRNTASEGTVIFYHTPNNFGDARGLSNLDAQIAVLRSIQTGEDIDFSRLDWLAKRAEDYVKKSGVSAKEAVYGISRTLALNADSEMASPYPAHSQRPGVQGELGLWSQTAKSSEGGLATGASEPGRAGGSATLRHLDSPQAVSEMFKGGAKRASAIILDLISGKAPVFDIKGKTLQSPSDFAALMMPLRNPWFESFKIAWADKNGKVIKSEVFAVGNVSGITIGGAKEVLANRPRGATKVFFSHNHPSGDPTPSSADDAFHSQVSNLAKSMKVEVVNLITNGDRYFVHGFGEQKTQHRADWEKIPRGELKQKLATEGQWKEVVDLLRQGNPGNAHIVSAISNLSINSVERLKLSGKYPMDKAVNLAISAYRMMAEEGGRFLFLDLPMLDGQRAEDVARWVNWLLPQQESMNYGILVDVSSQDLHSHFQKNWSGTKIPTAEAHEGESLLNLLRSKLEESKTKGEPSSLLANQIAAIERVRLGQKTLLAEGTGTTEPAAADVRARQTAAAVPSKRPEPVTSSLTAHQQDMLDAGNAFRLQEPVVKYGATSEPPAEPEKLKRHQTMGVRNLGDEYQPEHIEATQNIIRKRYFDGSQGVTPGATDSFWEVARQLSDPTQRKENADEIWKAVQSETKLPTADLAPGLLVKELQDYAIRMAARGDTSALSFMVDNADRFHVDVGGPASAAAKTLRALGETSTLMKSLKLLADAHAKAGGEQLGVGPELFAQMMHELRTSRISPEEVDAAIRSGEVSQRLQSLLDEAKPDLTAESTAERRAKHLSQHENLAERTAKHFLDKYEQRGVEWLKPDKPKDAVVEIIKNYLKSDLPIAASENARGLEKRSLAAELRKVGVVPSTAIRLADELLTEREINWGNRRVRQMESAANSKNIRSLTESILATPYRAQSDPAWRQKTAEDWFLSNGLAPEQAKEAAKLYDKQFADALTKAREKLARSIVEREAQRMAKGGPQMIDKMMKALSAGLFDPDLAWSSELMDRTGFRPLSKEHLSKLADLQLKLADTELMPPEQQALLEQMHGILRHVGTHDRAWQMALGEWHAANLLIGPRTLLLHVFQAPASMLLRDLPTVALTQIGDLPALSAGMLKALQSWWPQFRNSWQTDAYGMVGRKMFTFHNELKRQFEIASEDWNKGNHVKAMLRHSYAWAQYVLRFLQASTHAGMVVKRQWDLLLTGSQIMRDAGFSIPQRRELVDIMFNLKGDALEDGITRLGLSKTAAAARADFVAAELFRDWVANRVGSDSEAAKMAYAAEANAHSAVGYRMEGIKETDEGFLSNYGPNQFMQYMSQMRREGGLKSILGIAGFGFVNIPLRVAKFNANFSGYGILRYGIYKYKLAHGKESPWKQSMANDLQARQVLRQGLTGLAMASGALTWALTHSSADDDSKRKGFFMYVTGHGPKNKALYDLWYKAGNRRFSIVTGYDNVVRGSMPITRIGGVLAWPLGFSAVRDDIQWKIKEASAGGHPAKISPASYAMGALGTYMEITGAQGIFQSISHFTRIAEGGGGISQMLASAGSGTASAITLPGKQLWQFVDETAFGTPDRSSIESAIAANFPVYNQLPGLLGHAIGHGDEWNIRHPAINRFGDPLRDQGLYDTMTRLGLPGVRVADNPENKRLYTALVNKGVSPPDLRRGVIEERYRPMTDAEWQKFSLASGKELKAATLGNLDEITALPADEAKKFIAKAAQTADADAAMGLGLERAKPLKGSGGGGTASDGTSTKPMSAIAGKIGGSGRSGIGSVPRGTAPARLGSRTGGVGRRIKLSGPRRQGAVRAPRLVSGRLRVRTGSGRRIGLGRATKGRRIRIGRSRKGVYAT